MPIFVPKEFSKKGHIDTLNPKREKKLFFGQKNEKRKKKKKVGEKKIVNINFPPNS